MSYTLSQESYVRLKRRLSTKLNKFKKAQEAHRAKRHDSQLQKQVAEAAKQLITEAEYGLKLFSEQGYPDQWSAWERAKDDATVQLQMLGGAFAS